MAFVAGTTVFMLIPGMSMFIVIEALYLGQFMAIKLVAWTTYAVDVGVNKVRYSTSIVVVVIELVTLNDDTCVSNGFRNSEQNTVALNVMFAGLGRLLAQLSCWLQVVTGFPTDFLDC